MNILLRVENPQKFEKSSYWIKVSEEHNIWVHDFNYNLTLSQIIRSIDCSGIDKNIKKILHIGYSNQELSEFKLSLIEVNILSSFNISVEFVK